MATCKQCRQSYEITKTDLQFYDQVSPVFGGKKFLIPPPTLCPDCRMQRRMAWRNDRTLHHRKSDLTGKQIIAMYSADKPYKVYDQDEWWSDEWDPLSYGRDFDFNRTFQEQFDELSLAVPHQSLYTTNAQNSYYTNHALNFKDCYLIGGGGNCENCMYGRYFVNCKDTVDCASVYSCEWCYEGVASQQCYQCIHFTYSRNCSDCLMIEDCQGCRNCICCFGLKNAEYCILNERLSKEEFERRKNELGDLTHEKIELLRSQLHTLKSKLPHRHGHIFASEECTGDMIFNSKNCQWCFDVADCEDCKFVAFTPKGIHSQDCTFTAPDGVEWCYDTGSTVGMRNGYFCHLAWYGSEMLYSTECHHSHNILGCVGLKQKKYCIFNKQYTKEQYEELAAKILTHMQKTGEWGEYMPIASSRFCYNESVATDYFPLSKPEVLKRGWKWHEEPPAEDQYLGPVVQIPETIRQVDDEIANQILRCEVTDKPYKITPQELKFYRTLGIPLPRKSPDQRHKERLSLRLPRHLWKRKCDKCGKDIETSYSTARKETIYCEACYLQTVY